MLQNNNTVDLLSQITATFSSKRSIATMDPRNRQNRRTLHSLTLLLIIAGDVHVNPGPDIHCTMCKEKIAKEAGLQCNTCHGWCHIKCTGNAENSEVANTNTQFQWICPTENCKPNHNESVFLQNVLISPNRYKIPELEESRNEQISPKPKKIKISTSCQRSSLKKNTSLAATGHTQSTDYSLLEELTRITPEEYIGKDLCSSCFKEVKNHELSILCDLCEHWIHRKCSDMSLKDYRGNQKKHNFNWICNVCRTDDVLVTDKTNVHMLKDAEKPDRLELVEKSVNDMLILSLNFRSIMNKLEELENICRKYDPDILCITETWMDESVPAQSHIPSGYKVIRKDRSEKFKQKYGKSKGGGVAIFYKSHLRVDKKSYLTDEVEEILWVSVKGKESFMLGTVYRSEYTDILNENHGESKLEENIRKASEVTNRMIITGDFNIDTANDTSILTQSLTNLYQTYNLSQLIKKPTRIENKSGRATTIDHIWANNDLQLIKKAGTFMGVSDHFGTYMVMNMKKAKPPKEKITIRSYKSYSPTAYREDLHRNISTSRLHYHIAAEDVNAATEELISTMQLTAESHAPLKDIEIGKKKNSVPWYTDELEQLINKKSDLLADNNYYHSKSFKARIKVISNKIKHLKRKLKKIYIRKKFDEAEGNSKKCWKVINEITNRQKSYETVEPEMLNQNKVDSYNKFFASIGIEIQKVLKTKPHRTDFTGLQGFDFQNETEESISKLVDNIKIDVATGCDNIGSRLIKDAKIIIVPILTKIINLGYKTSTFPDCMKKATIKALHKKDDPDDISNYRPISILPTLSKIFERAATDQLVRYLEYNNLLTTCQHAYRRFHSTQTCLVEVVNHIYKLTDSGKFAAVVSLDLSKAFDSISHTLLLEKLSTLGLSETTLNWVKSYLTNRKQRTKFKEYISKEEVISSGVPQGSIIGPLLFISFTNDLPEEFKEKCKLIAYAEDSQLIIEAKSLHQLETRIAEIIKIAQTWYSHNSMKNNITKTEVLVINTKKAPVNNMKIQVIDTGKPKTLKPKQHIKILGVYLDDKLNWKKQISNVKSKAMNAIRNIHRINHLLPIKQRVQLYNSLISPQFDYADVVWGGCGAVNNQRLQVAQNFAIKSITGNKKSDSATASFNKLKFLRLEQRRFLHEAVFCHKSLLFQNPEEINNSYLKQLPVGNTRQAAQGKLTLPTHSTSKYENSPLYRSLKTWNSCPTSIPTGNIKIHKSALHKHIIQQTYG